MGKKWGKRGKNAGRGGTQIDPFAMQTRPPAPRSSPPASSTPLSDYLRRNQPGVTDGYVVLPRALVENMPLPWQQQLVNLLAQFHDGHARLDWPAYRVVPSRPERLVDLDEEQLAEAGYLVEIDSEGEMVYRERSGRKVDDPESVTVLVSCLDPVVERNRPSTTQAVPEQGRAAPMNIGPEPVWQTPPSGMPAQAPPSQPSSQPPQAPQSARDQRSPQAAGPVTASGSFPALAPQDAAPQDAAPQTTAPQDTAPQDAAPQDAAASEASQRDWFDEMPAEGSAGSDSPDDAGGEGDEAVFGPTGAEPTEIPYRFRR